MDEGVVQVTRSVWMDDSGKVVAGRVDINERFDISVSSEGLVKISSCTIDWDEGGSEVTLTKEEWLDVVRGVNGIHEAVEGNND